MILAKQCLYVGREIPSGAVIPDSFAPKNTVSHSDVWCIHIVRPSEGSSF